MLSIDSAHAQALDCGMTTIMAALAICISNGGIGSFEKYTPFYNGNLVGGETSAFNCDLMVRNQRGALMCISNGGIGSFEEFQLIDLDTAEKYGDETNSLYECIRQIP